MILAWISSTKKDRMMISLRPCLFAALMLFVGNSVLAQSASMSGKVFDAATGETLIGANVILMGTSQGAATDGTGAYLIANIRPGQYVVRIGYIGFETKLDTLVFSSGAHLVVDYHLPFAALEGEEVVVTAQAQGQLAAINRQLAEKSLVNVVSADRIEELPDANAAESLARIPGVTVQREGGEGNKVVIRGLSPKYNAVSVNGIRLAATDSSDRSTDLSGISQYMLEGIEVTKAGTPDQDGDVLGGTVNFQLKKAESGFHARGMVQRMYNDLRSSFGDYKAVFSASNRFFDDRLGLLALIDLEDRNRSSNELGASYYNPGAKPDSLNYVKSNAISLNDITRINNRLNSLVVTDFKFKDGSVRYNYLRSSIDSDQHQYAEEYALAFVSRYFDSTLREKSTRVNTHIVELRKSFASRLHIDASASRASSKSEGSEFSARLGQAQAFNTAPLGISVSEVQSIAIDDPTAIEPYDYGMPLDRSDETNYSYELNIAYDFRLSGKLSGRVKTGAKRRTKARSYDKEVATGRIKNSAREAFDSLLVAFPALDEFANPGGRGFPLEPFASAVDTSRSIFDGAYSIGPFADLDFVSEVADFFIANFSNEEYWEWNAHQRHETNSNLFDYSGDETYSAAYAMADISLGSRINVVAGARWEKNQTAYTSWQGWIPVIPSFSFSGYESVTQKRENSFLLPALFIRYRPTSWLELRAARTNTLARPGYADLIPLASYVGINKSVIMRNPTLKPAESSNLDLNASITNRYLGFASVTYFRKNIKNLIYSSGKRYIDDPELYGLPVELQKGFIQEYITNSPNEARLQGLELDYQTRFWYLPGFLSGLVFNGNYTVTSSEVAYPRTIIEYKVDYGPPIRVVTVNHDSTYVDRMVDQPDRILNISLGYDYKGFSVRLSSLMRSDIFRKSNFWRELRETSDRYQRWDLSMKQTLPMKGLDIYLNVSNITGSEDINRLLDPEHSISQRQFYGRTVDIGIRYEY